MAESNEESEITEEHNTKDNSITQAEAYSKEFDGPDIEFNDQNSNTANQGKTVNNATEMDFSKCLPKSYVEMDAEFLNYLKNFNVTAKYQEDQKLVLKEKFFKYVMFIMVAIILFPYVLIIMFKQTVTDATIITLSITSVAETMSAIIVLPKIIAKYLFNKKEEGNKLKLIEDMQQYNRTKRYSADAIPSDESDEEKKKTRKV